MQSDKFIKHLEDGSILLTAPVMIPGAHDCDASNGEPPLNPEQVRMFKESYDTYGFVDHEHGLTRDGRRIGEPSQSIILEEDTIVNTFDGKETTYPKGTWLLTTHITDDEAISEAMKGYYTGYSPSVLPRTRADKYLAALKTGKADDCACKNQLNSMGTALIKNVPDPVVLSVSLTKQPCLHESKICNLKKEDMNMNNEDMSLKSKVLAAIGMTEEAEVVALKGEVSNLQKELDEMKTSFTESLKSMQEEFKQTLTEALTPVSMVAAEKSEEPEPVEDAAEEEVEEEVEEKVEEVVAEKGESKAEPVHDNIAEKSVKPKSIYEVLGRNPNGTVKRA